MELDSDFTGKRNSAKKAWIPWLVIIRICGGKGGGHNVLCIVWQRQLPGGKALYFFGSPATEKEKIQQSAGFPREGD
ncbi:hypothetical protein ROHU_009162 [Labeo rohita]|uniref:Uncharacterized protein n=1 Tax=Labeo rohita TaxID=84645 RepID=A0A498M0U8_LABRO|nr:hypothetical protein ROHU_009162 [Labeo rohita]